jgi:hypothetical protein
MKFSNAKSVTKSNVKTDNATHQNMVSYQSKTNALFGEWIRAHALKG